MMATLRRFMALLLVVQWRGADLAGKPGPTFPDRAQNLKCERGNGLDLGPKKEARPKGPGNTLRVAAQYSQKTPKNNDLFGIWLVDFGATARLIALFGVGIDPPQNLLKMAFHGLIAQAGANFQRCRVANQDGAAAGLQDPLGLEGLD